MLQEDGYFVASPENESLWESCFDITEPHDSKHNNLVGLKTTQQ